jgi:UDP-glucose 4-epimerase
MKILVTGGAGFIGTSLVHALTAEHEVIVLDNLSTGKKENIPDKVTFMEGDIREYADVERAIDGCEAVFHLAAATDVRNANEDMVYNTNYHGSKNVFEAAGKINAKIIFASSAAVYGNAELPVKETAEPKPISMYGKSKLKAERLLDKNTFILRFFNVYGPRGNSVINKFCASIPKNYEIMVNGTGFHTRDYVYVTDVVRALLLGLEKKGTYNVGTAVETSIHNIIDMIQDETKTKAAIRFAPENEQEIKRSRADITKIKTELGWQPHVSIKDGIKFLLGKN